MANAKQCDRCGEFYAVHEPTVWENAYASIQQACITLGVAQNNVSRIMYKITTAVDLCPKCQDSLENWILEKEANNEND